MQGLQHPPTTAMLILGTFGWCSIPHLRVFIKHHIHGFYQVILASSKTEGLRGSTGVKAFTLHVVNPDWIASTTMNNLKTESVIIASEQQMGVALKQNIIIWFILTG